jgi:hypothetical protein
MSFQDKTFTFPYRQWQGPAVFILLKVNAPNEPGTFHGSSRTNLDWNELLRGFDQEASKRSENRNQKLFERSHMGLDE